MVDALRRAGRWIQPPLGSVIDLRPRDVVPRVELGLPDGTLLPVGSLVVDDERRQRHMAAVLAVLAVVKHGDFRVDREQEFAFYRYPDSVDELREHIALKWRNTRLDDATYARAVDLQRRHADGRLWLREQVAIRRLRPAR